MSCLLNNHHRLMQYLHGLSISLLRSRPCIHSKGLARPLDYHIIGMSETRKKHGVHGKKTPLVAVTTWLLSYRDNYVTCICVVSALLEFKSTKGSYSRNYTLGINRGRGSRTAKQSKVVGGSLPRLCLDPIITRSRSLIYSSPRTMGLELKCSQTTFSY